MTNGIRIGGAYYEITGDSAPLIQAMAKAEAQSKRSAEQIAQATGIPEKAVARYAATMIREQQRATQATEQSAAKIAAAQAKIAASAKQGEEGFLSAAKGAAGFLSSVAGVTVGAAAVGAAFAKISEETQKASQAQFALANTFKATAGAYTQFINQQAEATKRTTTEVKEAVVAFGSLSNRYAINTDQVKELTKRSADLAAVKGITTVEAAKRLEAALRGEAESAEFLGLTLNSDYLKKFADMTDAQRKNFETLDPLIKAQITYREVLKQTDDVQGAAAKRTQEDAGAFDNLKTAAANLSLTLGNQAAPAVQTLTNYFANLLTEMDKVLKKNAELNAAPFAPSAVTEGAARDQRVFNAIRARSGSPLIADTRDVDSGRREGSDVAAAADARRKDALLAAAAEADAIKQLAAIRKKQIADLSDAEEKAARKSAELEDRRIKQVIIGLEVERAARLKELETRERDTLHTIDVERAASKKASEEQIEQLEVEKKARIDAAEAARDAALEEIDARKRELDATRSRVDARIEDARRFEDQTRSGDRRTEDRSLTDARAKQDREREASNDAEIKRQEKVKQAALDAVQDEIDKEEDRSRRRLRNLDQQADKARKASEDAVRNIEKQADAENERHRLALQGIDDERDARLKLLDVQLDALDAAEKVEDAAKRTADLQRRLADAQKAQTAAKGTGTPQQIAEARGDLTRAIRVGDPVSIANATERLKKLAGQGAEAIKKADQDVADAQAELTKEGVDNARDAARAKLKAAADAIKAESDAAKRAEDDRNRERERRLAADKQSESDRLKNRLASIDKERQKEQESSRDRLDDLRDQKTEEQRAQDERIGRIRAQQDAQKQSIADVRQTEDRALEDRRRKEDEDRAASRREADQERADRRTKEDEALRLQGDAVRKQFEQERKDADEHYNGPLGVITIVKKAQQAADEAYAERLRLAKLKFDEERDAVKALYTNEAKTGLIDLQNEAADNNKTKLDKQIEDLKTWEKDASAFVEANTAKWKTLADAIEATNNLIRGAPNPRTRSTSGPRNGEGDGTDDANPPSGGSGSGGMGEALPPATIPAGSSTGSAPPPTNIPSQVNQYGFDDLSKLEQDAACGPATIDWFSSMVGRPLTGRQAVNIATAAGWDTELGMHGPGAMSAALASVGVKNQVIYGVTDDLIDGYARRNVPFALSTGEHYYQVYGGGVGGLNVGGSGQALRGGSGVMSLAAIRARGYEPQALIVPDESSIHTRDSGYLFRHPTLTYTPATGERNLIAERRPEMLVGGAATASMIDRSSLIGPMPSRDYAAVGASLSAMADGSASSSTSSTTYNIHGAGTEDILVRLRREQRRTSLLHGARRIR